MSNDERCSIVVSEEHPENIERMLVDAEASRFCKSIDFRLLHPMNQKASYSGLMLAKLSSKRTEVMSADFANQGALPDA